LKPYIGKFVIAYLDDILVYSPNFDKHLEHVDLILKAFAKANLLLSLEKCEFAKKSSVFLGFEFSADGYKPSDKHVSAIKTFPTPRNIKELRRFLGLVNFFRKHIPDRAIICHPLNGLTKKGCTFQWSEECDQSFKKLKRILSSAPLLTFPRFDKHFYLSTDASLTAIGGCLMQKKDDHFVPLAYCGRNLRPHEKNYGVSKLELLSVVFCIQYFRPYLEGKRFTLQTDHIALKSVLSAKTLTPQLTRFALILQNYDYEVQHIKGLMHEVPDCLSRRHYDYDETAIDTDIIDKYPDDQMVNDVKLSCLDCTDTKEPVSSNDRTSNSQENHAFRLKLQETIKHPPMLAKLSAKLDKQEKHRKRTFLKQTQANLQRNSLIGNVDLNSEWNMLYDSTVPDHKALPFSTN
jgi:hypothetical protein